MRVTIRDLWRYAVALGSVALAVVVLELLGSTVSNGPTAAQLLLLVLIIDGSTLGTGPAVVASIAAVLGFSRYFVTPTGFSFGDRGDWTQLLSFIILAVVVGELAARANRRAREAQEGRQKIARLYQELESAFDRASEAEALRRNEQLKAALLDALTHNLRTPLTSIKASVTALIAGEGDGVFSVEGRNELLQVIDEETDRLNRFIEGLSAAGTAAQPLAPRPVDVDEILRVAFARAETLTRDYHIDVVVTEKLPTVSVDAASITEVLYILLDNASKYAPPQSTIRVTAARVDAHYVQLSVIDEGPGIPAHARNQVFERFFRVPGTQSHDPRRKGIGLGLSIARRLVEAQGGRIWIDDSQPSGTAVRMTVPTADAQTAAEGRQVASPAGVA
ncbi:MAG TPA: ATP-binding protein [Vicinamibacterales bacterium]|nr:ATP-binding protein [Vicinamibacterales bacterium]